MSPILRWIIAVIQRYLREPYASLLAGITYGVPVHITPQLSEQIRTCGLSHLVVLSGANITLLLFLFERLFPLVGKRLGLLMYCVCIFGFISIVGLQPPLLRAAVMFGCTVICILTGRPNYALWNLWLSVVFTATVRPEWIASRSFHLSATATFALIVVNSYVTRKLPTIHPFIVELLLSIGVFLCALPLSIVYFRSISLVSPVATVLASPLITPLMLLGIAIPLFHVVFPPLALLLSIPTHALLQLLLSIISIGSSIPFGYFQW